MNRRGVIDRLLGLVDRPPAALLAWSVLLSVALIAMTHTIVWATGKAAVGSVLPDLIVPAVVSGYFVWFLVTLNRVARSSFNDFKPALGGDAMEEERFGESLTSVPDRLAIGSIIVAEVAIFSLYYGTVRPTRPAVDPVIDVLTGFLWGIVAAAFAVVIIHTIRQLRLISRLSSLARNVDIFKPAPINAFARLTALTATGILVFEALFVLGNTDQPPTLVAQEVMFTLVAAASFVLPLREMHNRLVAEKALLVADGQDRLKTILGRLHSAVDANDLSRADQLEKTLSSVLAEHEVLAKLPTWPWSTVTFRGFASALLVPVVIFVITQLIGRLL